MANRMQKILFGGKCPRCGGEDFTEHNCGSGRWEDDITYTSYSCDKCGLWYGGWLNKWLKNCNSWSEEETAGEYIPIREEENEYNKNTK